MIGGISKLISNKNCDWRNQKFTTRRDLWLENPPWNQGIKLGNRRRSEKSHINWSNTRFHGWCISILTCISFDPLDSNKIQLPQLHQSYIQLIPLFRLFFYSEFSPEFLNSHVRIIFPWLKDNLGIQHIESKYMLSCILYCCHSKIT